jgi:PAS domain S-box-containing protein
MAEAELSPSSPNAPASTPSTGRTPADLLAATPLFARVFHHSPVGMVISDADGRYVAVNDAFAALLGRTAAALLGRTPVESGLLDAAEFGRLRDQPQMVSRPDVPLRLRDVDGQPHELLVSIQPIELNGVPHTVSLVRDLSEFERLNASLSQSEQRFRLFFENAPLALVVSDVMSGAIVDVNPAACRQYGYERGDFLALSPVAQRSIIDPHEGVARHQTAAGRDLDVEVTVFTFVLGERPLRMHALRDVTDQAAAAAALRDSAHRFRIIAQVSNDGLWDWDLTSDDVWRSDGIPLFGQAPHDPAQPWMARVHPDDRANGRVAFERAVAAGDEAWSSEFRVRRPNGAWARVLQRGVILYEDGRPVRAIGATVDITTPLQIAEAEARAAQAERVRLARDLHDSVTQSLYSVTLLSEAARRHALDGQDTIAADYVTRLGNLAHQALRQMRLLVYELRPAVLDGEGLVGALRHRLDAVEKRAGIAVNLVTRGERPVPASVQGELFRIAHEALNNALKHAVATAVTVHVDVLGDDIVLEISDNGVGFDPTSPHTGLGLDMMRQRAARLRGELSIRSAPALGTTVRLVVPPPL